MKRCSTSLVLKTMKIETTSDSKVKSTDSTQRWPVCEGTGILTCHWWECKSVQPLCRTAQFLTKLNINLPCFSESSPRYLPKRNENICLQESLHKDLHSNFIYYSPNLEKIQMFISKRNDKQIVVYSYNGICLSNGKK